uniref:Retrovirus-related Pol polyprotein from transposon TNT 1-94 n=1 Tax=Tanacetum cinerariifolium TaxID=118510 RepID=A0A6L2KYJ7_TANCI|nr:retrovirus-related Pol polyprotein from transposon TNT 1-94 [Tanacetum cinerariifolium]
MKEAYADLTTELARYRGQEKSFEIKKAKFDELETGYRKSVYQEQCLTKKINARHLSSAKQITTFNEEIANLRNQLSKEKSIVSLLQEEKKKVLVEKHDLPDVYDSEETLQLAQESRLKMIKPSKTTREDKFMPINKFRASIRTKPITVSQPYVITKKDVNSDPHGLSSTRIDNTAKTRRPQPKSNTKNDTSVSKSSCIKNNKVEVEAYHTNLLLCKNRKHKSSECNNIKLAIRNDKSEKFLRNVHFGNDHVAVILGYGDLQWGNILIAQVYYVEGLGYNLFSVGQFCDSDLEAEAIATTCYIQNRSIIHSRFNKTPYERINDRKQDISFLHILKDFCYPKNDHEDIGKLGAKGGIGSKPELQGMTSRQISLGLDLTYAPSIITSQKPTERELDLSFKTMHDDYIGGQPLAAPRNTPVALAPQVLNIPTTSATTTDNAPTPTTSSS